MLQTPIQRINNNLLDQVKVQLWIKREDLIHPTISGNKYHKLKYNLLAAKKLQKDTLLTFGGAYSNHILATAVAGNEHHFNTIGIIRGEEHLPLNPTLAAASDYGMRLHYLNRKMYRNKNDAAFSSWLQHQFGDFYLIPEGGSNELAVDGCQDILKNIAVNYDVVCIACGTGGTIAGLIAYLEGTKTILGFPALKGGDFLTEIIKNLLIRHDKTKKDPENWRLITAYHFGGYAKYDHHLIDFIHAFYKKHGIPLDPIYTGKMMYGIMDLIKKGFFKPHQRILAIHTGGLQGIKGFNQRFGNLINIPV